MTEVLTPPRVATGTGTGSSSRGRLQTDLFFSMFGWGWKVGFEPTLIIKYGLLLRL